MRMLPHPGILLCAWLLLGTSCQKETRTDSPSSQLSASTDQVSVRQGQSLPTNGVMAKMLESNLLKDVRSATSRFNSTQQAIKAGYTPDNHCVSVPGLGGMGYHWANFALVDPVFDPLKPEVVLYATGPGGNLKLVAIEYIVVNTGQARPSFEGELFNIGGTPLQIPHWSLHVWLHEPNPNGMFTPFNPNISCP
ncbi:MAG TPA: hypothetical protein VFZ78_13490 [Flavisolibacter sp.]